MMYVNHQSWAHIVDGAASLLEMPREKLLEAPEIPLEVEDRQLLLVPVLREGLPDSRRRPKQLYRHDGRAFPLEV